MLSEAAAGEAEDAGSDADSGANWQSERHRGESAASAGDRLLLATQAHDFKAAERIIDQLGAADELPEAALQQAALHCAQTEDGGCVLLQMLRRFGSSCLTLRDSSGCSALHLAASHQSADTVHAIASCADPQLWNLAAEDGDTPLHCVARKEELAEAIVLIAGIAAAEALRRKNRKLQTPMHLIAKWQSEETVVKIANSVDPDLWRVADEEGDTPLHYCARNFKYTEALHALARALGTDCLHETNKRRQTPVHLAAKWQPPETIRKLADTLDPQVWQEADQDGETALHFSARNFRHSDALGALAAVVSAHSLSRKNNKQQTPLHLLATSANQSADTIARIAEIVSSEQWHIADSNGDTPLHIIALNGRHSEALFKLVDILGAGCLYRTNKRQQTPLHFVAQNQSADTIARLAERIKPDMWSIADEEGDTPLHYVAQNEEHFEIIFKFFEILNARWCYFQNKKQQTPLHFIAENQSEEAVAELAKILDPSDWEIADANGETLLHSSARNFRYPETLLTLADILGPECLLRKDDKQQTPLHLVAQYQLADIVAELARSIDPEAWSVADANGDTPLHFVALNGSDSETLVELVEILGADSWCKKNKRQQTPLHFAANVEAIRAVAHSLNADVSDIISWKDSKQRNVLFHACMNKRFEFLRKAAEMISPQQCIDSEGNTALHALFWNCTSNTYSDAEEFLRAFRLLVERGFDCRSENSFNQNCLHACNLESYELREILMRAELESFRPMLTNSQGMHAVHAFAGRYDLSDILQPLARLSDLSQHQLLHLTVSKGNCKGATCLHFACETGNARNVEFLVSKGLLPSATSHSGHFRMDFAFEENKLAAVIEAAKAAGLPVLNMLRLVDVPMRALNLPETATAHRVLVSFTDAPEAADSTSETQSQQVGRSDSSEQQKQSAQGKDEDASHMKILLRAVELDSPLIIRSLLSLDMLHPAASTNFSAEVVKKLQSVKDANGSPTAFLENFLLFIEESDKEPVSSVTACVHFEKATIIPDLLLIRQFDLIPTCIELLLHLRPKVAQQKGKHEQLRELQIKVVSMVVNALDELFVNADFDQRRLLFRFLKGEMRSEVNEALGPKFCHRMMDGTDGREEMHEVSVLQMVEKLDSDDLFATECLHQLARDKWNGKDWEAFNEAKLKRSVPRSSCCSCLRQPRAKFWVNSVFLLFFLLFFAWFITDFSRTFDSVVPWLLLLAYGLSYTTQEINDFYRGHRRKRFYLRILFRCSIRLPVYFKDVLNIFDILSLLFMWIGIVWHINIFSHGISHSSSYVCLMMLATSFLLWGFRSVAVLNISERIGPVISMLRKLLIQDLLPFLAILFVIFYSFGVFFVNLLFPIITASPAETNSGYYGWEVVKQVFTLPAFLLFGFFEKTNFENDTVQQIGKSAHPDGQRLFYTILMFLFLLLVNIVMVNLLIALFNLTVSRMASKAKGIWRKRYFEMVREYENMSIVPPPLSFLAYGFRFAQFVFGKCSRARENRVGSTEAHRTRWWRSEDSYEYCEEFVQFLQYQAFQFRRLRPLLTRRVTTNRGDFEQLRASTENSLAALQREVDARLDRAAEKLEEKLDRMNERLILVDEKLNERVQQISSKTEAIRTQPESSELGSEGLSDIEARPCVTQLQLRELGDRLQAVERRSRRQRKRMQQVTEKLDLLLSHFSISDR